ncbi:MAG TPA: ATP phosphoribosyltransferase regulatory subunit [Rhodospirillaceae bacterium]|jgi:ATP phosphoribosyltransferase regulatory subunit|nr:ATP phosphoribosyltransferase regulatory subunit [Alphaproteobacteria bacterium]HBH26688.1 ATP phosphoribosyltransferase regulatory subunit [Rhodospirillaceae bacterium]
MTATPPPALLPQGFADLLPPEAGGQASAVAAAMEVFARFGYAQVKPPLAEFEDTLLAPGPGAAMAAQTFRFMDPASRRMMALRADITPQIARIAATRLAGAPRPLRLSYANDALRVDGLGAPRQVTQIGCECIGSGQIVELALLAVLAARAMGAGAVTLDVTLPGRIGTQVSEVSNALAQRDRARVAALAPDLLPLLDACGPLAGFSDLAPLYADLTEALAAYDLDEVALTVDPVEQRGFEYHEGLAFALFAESGEVGRGGRYRLPGGEVAAGMTLYVEQVMAAAPPPPPVREPEVCGSWAAARAAQDAGRAAVT